MRISLNNPFLYRRLFYGKILEQKENIELKKQEGIAWYAIRVTYSREMIFKEYLDGHNVENFIPMHYESTDLGAKKSRKLVPIIHNLGFCPFDKKEYRYIQV